MMTADSLNGARSCFFVIIFINLRDIFHFVTNIKNYNFYMVKVYKSVTHPPIEDYEAPACRVRSALVRQMLCESGNLGTVGQGDAEDDWLD
jgi:hypothetical protein